MKLKGEIHLFLIRSSGVSVGFIRAVVWDYNYEKQ